MTDPAWLTLAVGIFGSVIGSAVTGAIAFAALKAWMARREVHEENIREDLRDHETRLRSLERHPMDYVPR